MQNITCLLWHSSEYLQNESSSQENNILARYDLHSAELRCSYSMPESEAKVECEFQNMHEDSFPCHKVISGCAKGHYVPLKYMVKLGSNQGL